ncbi:MAG: hypothetical protein DRJ60_07945 [Thermoprotei archaeon]|nr:MAG: hypothetical protein DRJ60_07945 [Thermoprotei archaeon]
MRKQKLDNFVYRTIKNAGRPLTLPEIKFMCGLALEDCDPFEILSRLIAEGKIKSKKMNGRLYFFVEEN